MTGIITNTDLRYYLKDKHHQIVTKTWNKWGPGNLACCFSLNPHPLARKLTQRPLKKSCDCFGNTMHCDQNIWDSDTNTFCGMYKNPLVFRLLGKGILVYLWEHQIIPSIERLLAALVGIDSPCL